MSSEKTAKELKVKGISAINEVLAESEDVVIQESRRDFEQGKFVVGGIEDHMSRIRDV